eukprot:scaffold231789_cov33-Tisochrysis_lutea.AAC.4
MQHGNERNITTLRFPNNAGSPKSTIYHSMEIHPRPAPWLCRGVGAHPGGFPYVYGARSGRRGALRLSKA